jgi:hypothetical protein
MKKLIAIVAVFSAVFAVNANAANLTVANTDLTLAGGISASYNYVSDRDDADNFTVDSAIVHLFKDPTMDSRLGGHLAFGGYKVKLVTGQEVDPTIGGDNYRPWLAYGSYMPVENLTVDAGLLWHKFGDAPPSILNTHVTRPVAFLAQPVAFAGGRVSYDAGIANFYAGYNDGSALDHVGIPDPTDPANEIGDVVNFGSKAGNEYAYEVGASAKVADMFDVAVNYFNYDEGYDTINASVGIEIEKFHAKVEANFVSADEDNMLATSLGTLTADDDTATTYLVYASYQFTDTFKLPVRVEFVDDNDSFIYLYDGWNVTITPTYNPTPNSFIRLEGVYASDDDDMFADDDGVPYEEDTRTSVILEFGFLF